MITCLYIYILFVCFLFCWRKFSDYSKNHLRVPSLVTKHQEAFQSVKNISLEASNLTWEHILQLAPMWPHIEALEVSFTALNTF